MRVSRRAAGTLTLRKALCWRSNTLTSSTAIVLRPNVIVHRSRTVATGASPCNACSSSSPIRRCVASCRADGDSPALVPLAVLKHAASRLPGHLLGSRIDPVHEAVDRSSGGNRFEPRSDVRRTRACEVRARDRRRVAEATGGRRIRRALAARLQPPSSASSRPALNDPVAGRLRLTLATDWTSLGLDEIEAGLGALHPPRTPIA